MGSSPTASRTATTPTTPTATSAADAACCPTAIGVPLGDREAATLAQVHAALADPVRLRLLSLLAASGEVCSCDLLEPLAKSQPTISHHTKVLAEAGLITGDKRGRWVYWAIAPERADFVRQALQG